MFTRQYPGTGRHKTGIIMVGHRPSCVYHLTDIPHVSRSPTPSPSVFTSCKQNTGGGNGLETSLSQKATINTALPGLQTWKIELKVTNSVSQSSNVLKCEMVE